MIPKYDDFDRYNAELYKLIDHIASGAESTYRVYAGAHDETTMSDFYSGPFLSYDTALFVFNEQVALGKKWAYIALDTRIGTMSVLWRHDS